jgi:hypothetical protein
VGISLSFKYVENTITTLKLKYKSLQKANSHPYSLRIINEEICAKNGETLFTLQIVGKNLVSKLYSADISNDKKLLKSLSPIDLLKILNIQNRNYLSKKNNMILFPCKAYYKLVAKSYNHMLQKTFFTLEITRANKTTQKKLAALEIANNPLILEKLTPQETYDLGFTVGSETILKEILHLASL